MNTTNTTAAAAANGGTVDISSHFHGAVSLFVLGALDAVRDLGGYAPRFGATSWRNGAGEAADPENWAGWPANLLDGNAPYETAIEWGYRPTEAAIAANAAKWAAANTTHTRLLFAGHCGHCDYVAAFIPA